MGAGGLDAAFFDIFDAPPTSFEDELDAPPQSQPGSSPTAAAINGSPFGAATNSSGGAAADVHWAPKSVPSGSHSSSGGGHGSGVEGRVL